MVSNGVRAEAGGPPRRSILRWAFVVVAVAGFLASIPGASSEGIPNGDAQATADTLTMNLNAANATIGMTAGRSIASYQDRSGSSEARALDLGVLPLLLATKCDDKPAFLNGATLPPLTRTDSSEPDSAASRNTQVFLPGELDGPAGAPIGFQDATATQTPSSWASTQTMPTDIILLGVTGGRTEVSTSLQNGVREAHATSTAEQVRILGGVFTFNQVRWEATARSGAATAATGSFTFASASVLGTPKPAAEVMKDLQGFKDSTEKILAPLGVTFDLPAVQVRDDGVKVTPMGFRIKNPPFGANIIMPFLGQNADKFDEWRKDVVAQNCQNETFLTVVDVLTGVMGGSGSIEALVGGVDVATHDTDYSVPPMPTEAPTTAPTTTAPQVADAGLTNTAVAPVSSDLGTSTVSTSTGLSGTRTTVPRTTTQKKAVVEQAVVPAASLNRYEDGTAGKAGVVVGALALLGALGLAMGDRIVGRRAKRRIP